MRRGLVTDHTSSQGGTQVFRLACVRHIRWPQHALDLLHIVKLRAESPVHAENLFVDDSRHWQAVEAVCERLPQLYVVSALACNTSTSHTAHRRTSSFGALPEG